MITRIEPGASQAQSGNDSSKESSNALPSIAYSAETVSALRAEGRPVFVNFTAAWCISCLVNERMVFSAATIISAFAENNVAYVKADWTNRDPLVTKALSEFDRAGVPLYLFYPAGLSDEEGPMILPQILTERIVLKAIAANGS